MNNSTLASYIQTARATISSISVAEYRLSGKLTIDVREADEIRSQGAVPNAINIPRGLIEVVADTSLEKHNHTLAAAHSLGATVDVICASGVRGALATKTLIEMGYKARNVDGGYEALKRDWRLNPD